MSIDELLFPDHFRPPCPDQVHAPGHYINRGRHGRQEALSSLQWKSVRGREDDRGFRLVPSPLLPLQPLQPAPRLYLRLRRTRQQDLLQGLLRENQARKVCLCFVVVCV